MAVDVAAECFVVGDAPEVIGVAGVALTGIDVEGLVLRRKREVTGRCPRV